MSSRKFVVAVVATVALLAGAVLAYFYVAQRSPATPESSDSHAQPTPAIADTPKSNTDRAGDVADEPLPEVVPEADESSLDAPAPATRVTQRPPNVYGQPTPALADRYDELAARARAGDIEAAQQLGGQLRACANYVERLDDLARLTHPEANGITPSQREANDARALASLERSKPLAEMCEGLSAERVAESQQWFELAANAGDLISTSDYYVIGVGELGELATRPDQLMRFRDNGSRFLHNAARRCNPEALGHLAMSYRYGTVTPVDPARSFGYRMVSAWASGANANVLLQDQYRTTLTPLQFNQAVYFARRAFSSYCQ